MSNQQRIQTVKIVWDDGDAKTKATTFTLAVKGMDNAVEELNEAMKGQAKVTAFVAKSQVELNRERKKAATAIVTQARRTQRLTTSLKQQIAMQGQSVERQAKMNALYRLGADATLSQRKEVIRLVSAMQTQNTVSGKTQKSMRGLRGQAQNFGWQMQDIAVQMQMGTDNMVIFSQQGSQLASGFGPGGAIIGALIAVGGAVGGVALKSWEASKGVGKLSEVTAELDLVFREGAEGADLLSDKILKLAERSQSLAKIEVAQGVFIAEKQIKSAIRDIADVIDDVDLGIIGEGFRKAQITTGMSVDEILKSTKRLGSLGGSYFRKLESSVRKIQDEYKITRDQAAELGIAMERAFTDKSLMSVKTLENVLSDLNGETGGSSKKLTELSSKIINLSSTAFKGVDRVNLLRKALVDLKSELTRAEDDTGTKTDPNKAFNALARSLEKQTITFREQYAKRKGIIDEYVTRTGETNTKAATAYVDLEKWKTAELAKEETIREKIRLGIESAQSKQLNKANPVGVEDGLFSKNIARLEMQKSIGELELDEVKRIDELIESEKLRHASRLDEIAQSNLVGQLSNYAQFTGALSSVFGQLSQIAEKGSAEAKALFYVNQAIAFADTVINTEMAATKALGQLGAFGIPTSNLIRATGYASAGVIAGTTFAGAFDAGGVIPAGQKGIVAEYGDELVGGTMVYNNSNSGVNVTGRKDTAAAMGSSINVQVINNAVGTVRAEVHQLDEGNVKILIAEHFSENIDRGVAASISKRGSKSDKAIRTNYTGKRTY